jgi:hypothetical protein
MSPVHNDWLIHGCILQYTNATSPAEDEELVHVTLTDDSGRQTRGRGEMRTREYSQLRRKIPETTSARAANTSYGRLQRDPKNSRGVPLSLSRRATWDPTVAELLPLKLRVENRRRLDGERVPDRLGWK